MDVLYLGIFIILSPAFDDRFYSDRKLPSSLVDEMAHAVLHFHSLLHIFSDRFIILLEGLPVAVNYILDRMLAEFAAAAVALAKGVLPSKAVGDDGITFSRFSDHLEGILKRSRPNVFRYYSGCLDRGHKHFVWTGPKLQIVPHSEDLVSVLQLLTLQEKLDHPSQQIHEDVDVNLPTSPASTSQTRKCLKRGDGLDLDVNVPASATSTTQTGNRRKRGDSVDLADGQPERKKR